MLFLIPICQAAQITPANYLFFAWNINGLSSKLLGDKLRNTDCLSMINSFDFIILSETWKRVSVDVEGFKIVTTSTLKTRKGGRNSGGLALLYKSNLNDWISGKKKNHQIFYGLRLARSKQKPQETSVCVAPISHHTIQITSALGSL